MNRLRKIKTKLAFTLTELLVVLAVIGILFAVYISRSEFVVDKAKVTEVQSDFRTYYNACMTVFTDNVIEDLNTKSKFETLLNANLDEQYRFKNQISTRQDGWGTEYRYGFRYENEEITVMFSSNSYGNFEKHYKFFSNAVADGADPDFVPRITMGLRYDGLSIYDADLDDTLKNQISAIDPDATAVTFDAGNGVYTASNTKTYIQYIPQGVSTFEVEMIPRWDGYDVVGFNDTDTSSNQYPLGAGNIIGPVSLTDDIMLHTIYRNHTYTLTLQNGTNSTPATSTTTATYLNPVTSITKPQKTGYTFNGYYTEENGLGTQYIKDDGTSARNWDITADTTLYAKWTPNSYTVTFNKNFAGDQLTTADKNTFLSPKTVTYDLGYGAGAALPTPTMTGYTFSGWFSEPGYTNQVKNDTIVQTASNHTLYAKWTANTYTVTFNGNFPSGSGSLGKQSMTVKYGQLYGDLSTAILAGHQFDGWYTAATGGTLITKDSKVNITANQTLYAHWTADFKNVAMGDGFTVVIDTEDNILGKGSNNVGQLGLGNTANASKFTKATLDTGVKPVKLFAKYKNSGFIDDKKNLWVTGNNNHGQLKSGEGSAITKYIMIAGPNSGSTINTNIKEVAFGPDIMVIITESGDAYQSGLDGLTGNDIGGFKKLQ